MEPLHDRKRILGIDLGQVRVGLALSDISRILATPLTAIQRKKNDTETIKEILQIAEENGVGEFVVGIPNSLSERNSLAADEARRFIEVFQSFTSLTIIGFDEKFTTVLASRKLREQGHNSRTLKSRIDASAASQLLQEYLDNRAKN